MTQPSSDERLVWCDVAAGGGLDGAWWPQTLDAAVEFRALVPKVSVHVGGHVRRVSANVDAWSTDQPRRLRIDNELVRFGWFHTLDAATVTLGRSNSERVTLLVIPPALDAPAARRLLHRLATATEWPDTTTAALSDQWTGDEPTAAG